MSETAVNIILLSFAVLAIIGLLVLIASRRSDNAKDKVEKIYDYEYRKRLEYERRRNELIDHYTSFTCDLVPYDDPDYSAKVIRMAEKLADQELELDEAMKEQEGLHQLVEGEEQKDLNVEELPW